MRISKPLCAVAMSIAAALLVIFALDLAIQIPFGRFSYWTDILVIIGSGLIIWQGVETWLTL